MSRMGLLAFLSEEDLSSAFEESVSTVNRGDYHCDCDGWIDGFFERNFLKISWMQMMVGFEMKGCPIGKSIRRRWMASCPLLSWVLTRLVFVSRESDDGTYHLHTISAPNAII